MSFDDLHLNYNILHIFSLQIRFSAVKNGDAQESQEVKINNSTVRTMILTGLDKYTQYLIQVLGYTRIGDGVPSTPKKVARTKEDGKFVR